MTNSDTARLRGRIDSGATRDKVRALDPAAAPLGTDDEAAGHGPHQRLAAPERDVTDGELTLDQPQSAEDPIAPTRDLPTARTWYLIFGAMLVLALIGVAASRYFA